MALATAPEAVIPELETPDRVRIRPAEERERHAAWALQRAAFDLPEADPPPHPGDSDDIRLVQADGKLVSCLTVVHARLCVRGAAVPMGGLRHVATDPDQQNQGFGSALVRDTLLAMNAQRQPLSVLFPFSFRYYRKFGYELGGNCCFFWCRPGNIPSYAERSECVAAGAEAAADLARFHREQAASTALALVRDEARWRAIIADPCYATLIHCAPDGALQGYAVVEETRDSYGGRLLRVLDLAAAAPGAWRALLGRISRWQAESVEWAACASALAASGLLRSTAPLREGFKPRGIATVRPMFQVRVTHLEEALRCLAPALPAGLYRLAIRARDELIPENTRPVLIRSQDRGVEVTTPQPADPTLEADIRIIAQILCGYMSPAEAVSQDLARCSSPQALETAERLFPAGDPFLSELDRF